MVSALNVQRQKFQRSITHLYANNWYTEIWRICLLIKLWRLFVFIHPVTVDAIHWKVAFPVDSIIPSRAPQQGIAILRKTYYTEGRHISPQSHNHSNLSDKNGSIWMNRKVIFQLSCFSHKSPNFTRPKREKKRKNNENFMITRCTLNGWDWRNYRYLGQIGWLAQDRNAWYSWNEENTSSYNLSSKLRVPKLT